MKTSIKIICVTFCFVLLFSLQVGAQEIKKDQRTPLLKEDSNNQYRSTGISQLDMLHALDFMGVRIHKFDLGEFDQKYELHIFAETYKNGEIVKTDTMVAYDNEYHYFEEAEEPYYLDYIDQLKFITKTEDNKGEVRLHTYAMSTKLDIELEKWDDRQFYNWRFYSDAKWELNKKIPLMVFASSWEDKQYGFHRFCGVVNMEDGEAGTEELLSESPTYILFSYKINPILH